MKFRKTKIDSQDLFNSTLEDLKLFLHFFSKFLYRKKEEILKFNIAEYNVY